MLKLTDEHTTGDLSLTTFEIEQLLDGWVVERHGVTSPEWARIVAAETWKMRGKRIKFGLLGALPGASALGKYRTEHFIKAQYSSTWSRHDWPDKTKPPCNKDRIAADWRDAGFVLRRGAWSRMSLALMTKAIEQTRPKRVLEVGCGWGINLFTLSARFPDIEFTGVELTDVGIDRARATQGLDAMPDPLVRYGAWQDFDHTAFKRIEFRQGDATDLPFDDGAFDLVFSNAALEQMENVREKALSEIRRVAAAHLAMCEPFGDFNTDPLRRLSIRAKNYLTLRVDELTGYGIEPVHVFADWPNKITAGMGFVLARPQ